MDQSSSSAPARVLQLLREAYVSRRSGRVHITHGPEGRTLSIREGHVVQGRSNCAGEHLGEVLLRHAFVGPADLDRAVDVAVAEERPLGTVLVELGLIDQARLEDAVGLHVREILFAALDRPDGTSAFEELESLPEAVVQGDPASRLSTGQLLLEAARRLPDPEAVREALGDLDRKLSPATDPRLRVHPVALTPTDGFVLSRVDGTLSARELIGLIPLPAEETERSLLGLLCTGAVDYAPDRPLARPTSAPSTPSSPAAPASASPASAPPTATAAGEPSSPAPGRSPEEVRRLILETHASLPQRDHFELLGVTPEASAAELRAAYARLARVLHPDACSDAALADVDEQRNVVFLRVCQAYETLREPAARAAYEQDLRRRKPWPASSAAATASSNGAPPPAAPAPPELSLEDTIAAAEELLRDGSHWEAVHQLEPTLRRAEGPLRVRALVALARGCLKNPEWLKRAESYLQEAVHEDPSRAEAYLLLGDIYRDSQLRARATAMYRKALDQQPSNRHALRELAQLEGEPPPPSGGVLGFLKKR
jgi:hypothetical protein